MSGVWLCGIRGSGKTTLGRLLAAELGCPFTDLDAEVARVLDEPVGAFLEREGAPALRRKEGAVLASLWKALAARPGVLALGGGSVEAPEVERMLTVLAERQGWVGVWLRAPPEVCARRVGDGADRPLLAGRNALEEARVLLARRAGLYKRLSSLGFETAELGSERGAKRLRARLAELGV